MLVTPQFGGRGASKPQKEQPDPRNCVKNERNAQYISEWSKDQLSKFSM